jgi:predicted Zn-dependent protease
MIRSALAHRVWLFSALLIASSLLFPPRRRSGRFPFFATPRLRRSVANYVAPILRAAGIRGSSIQIVLVNERDFNAFVADGRRIFINLGVICCNRIHPMR